MSKKRSLPASNKRKSVGPTPAKVSKTNNISAALFEVRNYTKKPGDVLTFGQGDVGQLGLGADILERLRPALVNDVGKIVSVCAGGMHTLCLTEEGKVMSFGCNDEGALGRETAEEGSETLSGAVELPGKAVQVTAGDSHSAALLDDGRVFAWGAFRDSHGSMGLTPNGAEKFPVQMPVDSKVVKIASGGDHLVMLTADGLVYTCGCGEQGQLGRLYERTASRESRQGLNQLLLPALVISKHLKKVDDIWAGTYCTFFKEKSTDNIYACGLNNYFQLGLGKKLSQILRHFHPVKSEQFSNHTWRTIAGGQHHTLALDTDNVTYVIGRHEYGRLGLGENGKDIEELTIIPSLQQKKCVEIACGSSVSFAVTDNGEVYSWGMGTNGQLGSGEEEDLYEPKKVGGKQLEGKRVVQVSSGGQHTVILTN